MFPALSSDRWAGWALPLAAAAAGAVAACGFEPLHLWPLALLGVAALLALVAGAKDRRRAFLLGWLWGVGHFTLGLNWIATAFSYQAKMPVWLGWGAVVGLALYLAIYPALAGLGAWFARRDGRAMVLTFAGCWTIGEWLRGWVFTGFPWNPLGAAMLGDLAHPGVATLAPWLGTYALSGLTALLAGAIALAFGRATCAKGARRSAAVGLMLAIWAVLALPLHFGFQGRDDQGHIPYTLVQPNIAQQDLNDPAHFEAQFQQLASLSPPVRAASLRLVLWPESGVPDFLRDGYPRWAYAESTYGGDPFLARWRIGRAIGWNSLLLTGASDLDVTPQRVTGARVVVTALDGYGRIRASYAKAHLVPYGEYLPMRSWLEPLGVARLVPGDIDYQPGPGPGTLDLGALGKAGVQICYEIVFPGAVIDRAHRPDYIFNPTNDGWFGSWGPPQHLAQARLRAIEEGLPVLRATTNGISAVIDADGVARAAVPRGEARRVDGLVPPAHAPTLFARWGNVLSLLWAVALIGIAALVLRRGGR